jgi:multiple sugar transport system permease protein
MLGKILIYVTILLVGIFAVVPVLWAISTSLKSFEESVSYPPKWIPGKLALENFVVVVASGRLYKYLLNSLLVTGLSILLGILFASLAGYAGARFGKTRLVNGVLLFLLFASMIPEISYLIPLYRMLVAAKLYDTFGGLTLVYVARWTPPVAWMLRGFFETIPPELEEAATIDGCSHLQSLYKILIPLARPGFASVAIYIFVMVWNDFLFAYSLMISDAKRLSQVALYHYLTSFGVEWNNLCAAVVTVIVPVLVFFVVFQKNFIQGLTSGSFR